MTSAGTARAALLALLLCWLGSAAAQIPVPALSGHVTDLTSTLDSRQKATLEQTLQSFEARKGSQIAVLLVPSTAPETIEQFALRVAEQWQIGRRKVDDGAILVVAKNDRTLRIEVGYGLEGALNDATSKRIISETITPRFRQGEFYGGIAAGVEQMIRVVDGEPLPSAAPARPAALADLQHLNPLIFIGVLALGIVLRAVIGRLAGAVVTGGIVGGAAWLFFGVLSAALMAGAVALVVILLGGGMGGRVLAGLGAGGLRGGGFSGGGGSFGGGGASGEW